MDDLGAVDEVEAGQCHDAVAVERRLEREVEAGECLHHWQPRHAQRRLDPAVLAERQFLEKQFVQRLDAVNLPLFDAAQGGVEHLQRTRHLQPNEAVADIVDPRRCCGERHGLSPIASCVPIA